jgi:hypothetical protein
MDVKFDLSKKIKDNEYNRQFLEAIIFSSISEKSSEIPTIKEFILSEVINGTIDYIGGNVGKITYQNSTENGENDLFEIKICKYLKQEIHSHNNGLLEPKIMKALNDICKDHYKDFGDESRGCHTTELYDQFLNISQDYEHSIFSPFTDTIPRNKESINHSFSAAEKTNIEGIGKAMRKHVDNDIIYIRKNYSD